MDFDTTLTLAFVSVGLVILALASVVIFLLSRRQPSNSGYSNEIVGRLAQISETQQTQVNQMQERLQLQERAFTQLLDDRLTQNSVTLSESLQKQASDTSKTLGDLRQRLGIIATHQAKFDQLARNIVDLQEVLSNKQARGAFGEVQLQNIVSNALPRHAYELQYSFQTDFGADLKSVRVDCLIKMPNPPGPVAIDSKFPLESYREFRQARDDNARKTALQNLSSAVRKHLEDIASKYIIPGKTATCALMFLPSEAVYAEIYASLPAVIEESQRLRVYIVSPTTMMALLNTVRAVQQDVEFREQTQKILQELDKIASDVGRLDQRVGKLRSHFSNTQKDISAIQTSTEKIIRSVDRIQEFELDEPALPVPSQDN